MQHRPLVLALGLVWLAHIGLDQLLGYGLKYDDSFQHTHLGILGRKKEPHDPGCITGILLIAVVVLQMRVRTLILRSLLLPPGLVAGAGSRSGLAEGPAVNLRRDPAHAGEVPRSIGGPDAIGALGAFCPPRTMTELEAASESAGMVRRASH